MKFIKKKDSYLFPIYEREDNKFSIKSSNRFFGKTLKQVYIVLDSSGNEIDVMLKLREAQEKYSK